MRVTISRRFEFDAGHRVPGHEGKCRNLHGHRYVAIFTFIGRVITTHDDPKEGMIDDFSNLKDAVGRVIDRFDHGFIVFEKDQFKDILVATGTKVIVVPYVPTAENLARDLMVKASYVIDKSITCSKVTLYEAPNCYAEVTE